MSKPVRIVVGILLVSLLGVLSYEVLRPREPTYEGRLLSSWCKQYSANYRWSNPFEMRAEGELGAQAETAIRNIGTNAIPTLLQMLRANDPPWKLKMLDLLSRQRVFKVNGFPANLQHGCAMVGFYLLGAEAREAVPALIEIYERNISESSEQCAAFSLGAIGPPAKSAVFALLNGLTNSDYFVRLGSIHSLGQIHAEPQLVVPALINCLRFERSAGLAMNFEAADALGSLGMDAEPAIPVLIESLDSPIINLRMSATNALKQIDPAAAAKAGIK